MDTAGPGQSVYRWLQGAVQSLESGDGLQEECKACENGCHGGR